eukprot:15095606-Alexandrium_andersonii.AAC.1
MAIQLQAMDHLSMCVLPFGRTTVHVYARNMGVGWHVHMLTLSRLQCMCMHGMDAHEMCAKHA